MCVHASSAGSARGAAKLDLHTTLCTLSKASVHRAVFCMMLMMMMISQREVSVRNVGHMTAIAPFVAPLFHTLTLQTHSLLHATHILAAVDWHALVFSASLGFQRAAQSV